MPTLNLFTQDLIQSKYEYLQDRESTTFLGNLFQFSSTFKVKMLSFNLVWIFCLQLMPVAPLFPFCISKESLATYPSVTWFKHQ